MTTADPRDRTRRLTEPLAPSSPEAYEETAPVTEPVLAGGRLPVLVGRIRRQLVWLSFWTAVFLPVFYVPLLLVGTGATQELLLVLIGVHVVALLGGRSYHGKRRSRDAPAVPDPRHER